MTTDIATAIAITVAMVRASRITKIRQQKQCMHVGRVESSWRKSKSSRNRPLGDSGLFSFRLQEQHQRVKEHVYANMSTSVSDVMHLSTIAPNREDKKGIHMLT